MDKLVIRPIQWTNEQMNEKQLFMYYFIMCNSIYYTIVLIVYIIDILIFIS